MQEVVRAALADSGRIDGLVNNAGGQFAAPLEKISAKGWDAVVRTNLTGGFLMARECYTQWMKQQRRRDRQHDRRHVERHARHGPLRRGARRHAQFHRDGSARVGAGARQCRRARLDRLQRHGPVSAGDARAHPLAAQERAARPASARNPRSRRRSCSCSRPAAAFISGSCLRIDGARAERQAVAVRSVAARATQAFDGFHLAAKPKVLE